MDVYRGSLARLEVRGKVCGEGVKRLLIVDDERGILQSLKALLDNQNLVVDTTDNAGDAVILLKQQSYDAVISDIRLNDVMGVDGLRLLGYIRDNLPETKVIILTGYGNPDCLERALNLGASFYFEKPVSITALQEALTRLGIC